MTNSKKIMIVVGVLVLILFAWGLIGSSETSKLGNTCDFGINEHGSVFCWKWHQNIIGDVGDDISQLFEN